MEVMAMIQKIYFVTKNKAKFYEAKKILEDIQNDFQEKKWELILFEMDLEEVQTNDVKKLVREKALTAFKRLKRIVLVEQTSLKIDAMGGLPGLQSAYILSGGKLDLKDVALEDIVSFCKMKKNFTAKAETNYCLCDGKNFYYGVGTVDGSITEEYKKREDAFGWDCIFRPNGKQKSYADDLIGKWKNSMRRKALEDLFQDKEQHEFFISSVDYLKEQQDLKKLAELIKDKKVMLFIGAGVSASENLPSWGALMGELGETAGFDKEIFLTYGDSMMLAEYLQVNQEAPVRQHLQNRFDISEDRIVELFNQDTEESLYSLIAKLDVPVIYTTNFDNLIELYMKSIGKDCCVCKEMSDIQNCKSDTMRIMKFHGDISQVDKKEKIVLAESQYYGRMRLDSFMDIQLQADVQKYHILFLGYSLSDINVKMLMYIARHSCENEESMPEEYIFTATPNRIQRDVFAHNGIISISNEETDKYKSTKRFLQELVKLVDCNEV